MLRDNLGMERLLRLIRERAAFYEVARTSFATNSGRSPLSRSFSFVNKSWQRMWVGVRPEPCRFRPHIVSRKRNAAPPKG